MVLELSHDGFRIGAYDATPKLSSFQATTPAKSFLFTVLWSLEQLDHDLRRNEARKYHRRDRVVGLPSVRSDLCCVPLHMYCFEQTCDVLTLRRQGRDTAAEYLQA